MIAFQAAFSVPRPCSARNAGVLIQSVGRLMYTIVICTPHHSPPVLDQGHESYVIESCFFFSCHVHVVMRSTMLVYSGECSAATVSHDASTAWRKKWRNPVGKNFNVRLVTLFRRSSKSSPKLSGTLRRTTVSEQLTLLRTSAVSSSTIF